ncbi:TRAP transporter large permease [Thermodesulforhabdus norvegica]|uniref:Tripartite ATP-independent transporter, DctM component n=1 Tax=Thermodesulforhabdus norvegica TaxID=39841 RepID=A0A1I4R506_9BACT|nr:TRAP transporter large permease [Thermodesulforhabdus norvegica]SFM47003.1 Tripartite ATP-independent transporter, DctM component [Thermodesulforhabdus norvegica]
MSLMLWVVAVFLFCCLMGMPLFFSFGISAAVACILGDLPLQIIAQRLMIGMDSFALLAIPGFVLAGEIMCIGGISRRAVDFSNSLVGHFRGGLSMVAVLTGMIMGGISGSAVADTAAVASVLVPLMEKEKYPKEFSSAVVGTAGPLGNIIPPSIPMIVYSMTAGLSLLDLFLAGYIPGMMIGFSLMAMCYIVCKKKGYGPSEGYRFSWATVWNTFRRSILAILTPLIIVGGIVSGVFTPTESAMIGVVYSLAVAIYAYRELKWSQVPTLLLNSAKTTAKLVIIIAAASVFSYISINEGIPELFQNFMFSISTNKWVVLFVLNIILLLTGLLLDILVATVIIVPVLIPLADALGINQLHMAMIFILNMSIGLLTPPVGYCLFVSSAISQVPVEKTALHAVPVIITMLIILFLINLFPQLTLVIPGMFG